MTYSSEVMKQNETAVLRRLVAACQRCGRSAEEIEVIWVSKTHPAQAVLAAWEAGARNFGENRVQELEEKFSQPLPGVVRHLIGPVQSNKLRKAVACADVIHTVSSLQQLSRIEALAAEFDRSLRVLFQVNTSAESCKSGLSFRTVDAFLSELPESNRLLYSGLMAIGPNTGIPEDARVGFRQLKVLLDEWRGRDTRFREFSQLSIGMSADLEVAIEEGATWLRIGTALFGVRDDGTPTRFGKTPQHSEEN